MHKTKLKTFLTYKFPSTAYMLWITLLREDIQDAEFLKVSGLQKLFFLTSSSRHTCGRLENTTIFYWAFYSLSGLTPALKPSQARIIALMLYITELLLLSPSVHVLEQIRPSYRGSVKVLGPFIQSHFLRRLLYYFHLIILEIVLCLVDCQSIWHCL